MPWDWPVEVNCFEGAAYCRWVSKQTGKACRLPTEDEYYAMLKHIEFDYTKATSNIALKYSSPNPVNLQATQQIYDPMGNVWQWTCTPMYPF